MGRTQLKALSQIGMELVIMTPQTQTTVPKTTKQDPCPCSRQGILPDALHVADTILGPADATMKSDTSSPQALALSTHNGAPVSVPQVLSLRYSHCAAGTSFLPPTQPPPPQPCKPRSQPLSLQVEGGVPAGPGLGLSFVITILVHGQSRENPKEDRRLR